MITRETGILISCLMILSVLWMVLMPDNTLALLAVAFVIIAGWLLTLYWLLGEDE